MRAWELIDFRMSTVPLRAEYFGQATEFLSAPAPHPSSEVTGTYLSQWF